MQISSNKILVTGGAGLVGTELIHQLLADGSSVRALWNQTPLPVFSSSVEKIRCDILDIAGLEEAMENVSKVYHCAAAVSFEKGDKKRLYKINVEGTANVVNAALAARVEKLVHVSSVAALGRLRQHVEIDETMSWTPETSNSIYGHSKYLGEMEVWRGIAEGLNAVIVNPSMILGAGNWNDSSTKLFKSVYEQFPWYSNGTTGFVDVRDVAAAMIQLMESDISGERFILSGENESYGKVFTHMAKAFGKKPPSRRVTPALAAMAWRVEAVRCFFTGSKPLLTKETAATGLSQTTFNNKKLLKALPAFRYRPLLQTINETCATLQQKINKA